MKHTIYIVGMSVVLSSLSACQSEEPNVGNDIDRRVYLAAQIESVSGQSRVPYQLAAPTLANPLEVDVWASTTQNEFKDGNENGSDGRVSLHTTARFTSGQEQLLDDVIYPEENTVYFVGLHPENWQATDGKSAAYTFDGKEDVMFAPQKKGRYAENVDAEYWPVLTFNHLLTWLRIEMVAENETVSAAWGKVKSLKVKSPNGVTVDLSKDYTPESCISFSGNAELPFYRTGADVQFPSGEGYVLKGPFAETDKIESYIEEVAYVLCAPVDATEEDKDGNKTSEYTLLVETEKRKVELSVDLKKADNECFTGTTMNHKFLLLLNFKMGDNISVMATQTDWKTEGIGSKDFNESDLKNN